jgi:hypothetical protein
VSQGRPATATQSAAVGTAATASESGMADKQTQSSTIGIIVGAVAAVMMGTVAVIVWVRVRRHHSRGVRAVGCLDMASRTYRDPMLSQESMDREHSLVASQRIEILET